MLLRSGRPAKVVVSLRLLQFLSPRKTKPRPSASSRMHACITFVRFLCKKNCLPFSGLCCLVVVLVIGLIGLGIAKIVIGKFCQSINQCSLINQ